jgi:nicotinate-nucleotide adenylyltransferase
MKVAVLGGSFNPIHMGHLLLADTVISEMRYDRVILVPACHSPFKPSDFGMENNARDRLEMIAASIAGDPRLNVDDCEIRRGGISYTIDTITDIIRRYAPDAKPGLIIGDDLAAEFPQWHKSDELLALVDIIIARRIHSPTLNVSYPCTQIPNDVIEISSGAIREKIAANTAWRYLVPSAARTIIEDRELYGCVVQTVHADGTNARIPIKNLILRVEEAAREDLHHERFLHSRNTALMTWDLCRRFGSAYNLDPQLGYLAGLAHDLGKSLSDKELIKVIKNDNGKISQLEKEKPSLLHGRASAILLRDYFDVHNEAVLEAAALHTAGGKNMGPLAKMVYIADKMEVSREKADPSLRKLVYTGNDLDRIFTAVLEQTVFWLLAKKVKVSEETLSLLEKMRRSFG